MGVGGRKYAEKPKLEARGGEMWRGVGEEENIRPEKPMQWA